EALAAFEKALAKGTAKPGEAPQELTALREAVELAAKKGENVEAISKELGVIEKSLTGRAYDWPETPEPPPPQPLLPPPVQAFPRRGGGIVVGGAPGPRVVVGGRDGGSAFNITSVLISNGKFIAKARQGDVSYLVTGSVPVMDELKIVIQDGEKKI